MSAVLPRFADSITSPVVFDDIDFSSRPYEAWSAYGRSKPATILFAVALAKKWAADVPPGWKTVEQGAATTVLLAASPLVQGVTGRYFEDANEALVVTDPGAGLSGVAGHALDANDADRLWDETTRRLQR